ncbi:hypothetical protein [Providencia vermicola]|uniref:hypothetical protein n=1 Tax=Providencia vermicola TaxID=333965 RepID=UPI0013A74279|nr:hypothetical protein [Providencia vermicola]QIC15219.1 hypothetical protein G3341_05655 [Providencia vermicola]
MNTHFLYLFGHLRLLEQQHALVSLNKTGIGLIGSPRHNQWYTQAILHSQHHCELKSVCVLESPLPSASYFICQKRKIEQLIENDAVDTVIVTSVCSDELLKFIIQATIHSGKNILLNNVPNYGTNEFNDLLKLAKQNDANICQSNVLLFSNQYDKVKAILSNKSIPDSGLLRLSAHRQIDQNDPLSKAKLRSLIAEKVTLLLNSLPDFKFDTSSVQYSRPLSNIEAGDVLIINLKNNDGFLVSFELFFNTGNVSDKLSLKQHHHDLQFENFLMFNNQNSIIDENSLMIKQLDYFILSLHKINKIRVTTQLLLVNQMTESILTQLELSKFI